MAMSWMGGSSEVTVGAGLSRFLCIAGTGGNGDDDSELVSDDQQGTLWPSGLAADCVSGFDKLAVEVSANATTGPSTVYFRLDGVDQLLLVEIPAGTTGWFVSDSTFVGAGGYGHPDRLLALHVVNGGGGSLTLGQVLVRQDFQNLDLAESAAGTVIAVSASSTNSYGPTREDYAMRVVGTREDQDPGHGHTMRHAGTARYFQLWVDGCDREHDVPVSLTVNGVPALTIDVPATVASPTRFVDNAGTVALVDGDVLGVVFPAADFSLWDATSGSSHSLTNTVKVFVTSSGMNWAASQVVDIYQTSNRANKMTGTVTAYVGTALTVSISTHTGTGTFSDWTIEGRPPGEARVWSWRLLVETDGPDFDVLAGAESFAGGFLSLSLTEGYATTSTDSRAIGLGVKVFTVDPGLPWTAATDRARISTAGDKAVFMEGRVTDYTDDQLTVLVDDVAGAGTFADWVVNRCITASVTIGNNADCVNDPPATPGRGILRVPFDCSVSKLRAQYFYFATDPGFDDLPHYFRLMRDGSPIGPRVVITTPDDTGDDYAGKGFAESTDDPVNLLEGDLVWMEAGVLYPEDATVDRALGTYPSVLSFTVGLSVDAPAEANPPRFRMQLAVN